jgi:dipeptidyl aminopeptidase/acylaminoacyl peptidase
MRSDSYGESGTRLPIASRSKLIVALLSIAISALVSLPAGANATLAFNTDSSDPEVWVSGNDDGTEATYVGRGLMVQVSPDGELLAYEHGAAFVGWELIIYNVATGTRSVRLTHMHTIGENVVGETTAFAWSPDSTMMAVLQNERRSGKQTLYVIHAKDGGKRRIATGHFRGVSFSPDGKEVVFGVAHSEGPPPKTDIARAPVTGGPITLLTDDHISGWPLWGPRGEIAFSKRSKSKRWKSRGEVWTRELFNLFVMKANGERVKQLTRVGAHEAGFFPAFWFPSGERLVANFQSLDNNYAALVDPKPGTVKPLNPPISGAGHGVGEAGFAAVSLTADEQTVLGCFGSVVFAGPPPASVPVTGGVPTVLNEDAWSPSWSGLRTVGASPC